MAIDENTIIGQRYGKLTIERSLGRNDRSTLYVECRCDCGKIVPVRMSYLTFGHTKSCGCLRNRVALNRTHGEAHKTTEWATWVAMRQRCEDPSNKRYDRYGGRGIKVCDRWLDSYEHFLSDMGRKPSPKYSLDRYPDQNGNYEPGNCRWATPKQQQRNRTNNRLVTINGETKVMSEWLEIYGVDSRTACNRIHKLGWEPAMAVSTPSRKLVKHGS